MESYDTIVLLLVLGGAFLGWRKGLATQVASVLSIGVSVFVAGRFGEQVTQQLELTGPWHPIAVMLGLFIGSSLIIWLIFRQIRNTIEAMKLKEFDYQMGALLGAAKGFIVACLVTLAVIAWVPNEDLRQTVVHSRSGNLIAHFLNHATPILPEMVRNRIAAVVEQLDAEMQLRRAQQYAGEGNYSPTPIPPQNTFPGGNTNPGYQPGYQQPPSGQYGGNGNVIPPAYGGNPSYGQQPYGRTAENQPTYQGGNINSGNASQGYPNQPQGYGNQPQGYGNSSPGQYQPPNSWPQSTGTPSPGANPSNQDWRANSSTNNGRF